MSKEEYDLESVDLQVADEAIYTPRFFKFSAGKINLQTGEVTLNKEVSEAAKEFWEELERAFPF